MRIKPSRLDWYILSEILGPFLGGLVFFLFIFLMFQALRLAEFFIVHGAPAPLLGKMTLLMALSFMPTALPVAFLIAVLIGFGRLSADSELVAMKASGVSTGRMATPITLFAIVVFAFSVFLNQDWVPWGERAFKTTLIRVSNTKVVSSIREGTFTSGFFDLLIFADKVDTKNNQLSHVFIYDEREPKNPLTVVAKRGEIVSVRGASELASSAMLRLYDGSIHRNDIENNTYQKIEFGEYNLYLKIDEGSDAVAVKPHMIPQQDLLNKIAATTTDTYEGREWRGEYWRRYAIAISPIIFGFLGIGYGSVRTRSVRAGATLTAVLILIVYWTTQTFATIWYQRGIIHPLLAMQLPNILAAILAFWGIRRARW